MSAYLSPDEDPPLVCADRIGRLTWPHGTTEAARVILTRPARDAGPDATPQLWVWTPGSPPRLVYRDGWTPAGSRIAPDGSGTWEIATGTGMFTVAPGGGCVGCGSALAFSPWNPYRRVSMPADLGSSR